MSQIKIAALASHGGSNLQAIIQACSTKVIPGKVVLVISNNSQAGALEKARQAKIKTLHLSSKTHPTADTLDLAMLEALDAVKPDLITLAGYMKKIGPRVLHAYEGRIINIHPALLPKYGGPGMYGMNPHEAVIADGETETGATVHVVNNEYDSGPILMQRTIEVLPGETAVDLQTRVLELEHQLYPEVIQAIVRGEITLPTPDEK